MNKVNKHLDVLIIEDSEDDALLEIIQIKKGGYDCEFLRVETAQDLRIALHSKNWDIILSDYKMPDFNGLEALSIVKESEKDIPFIMISGTIGEDLAVGAMKAGAHDYLMKDSLKRLLPAIEREMRELKNREKQRKLEYQEKLLIEERLAHFRFFQNMDKINRAIQVTNDLKEMLNNVMDLVLSMFNSDRAYLIYPCETEASTCNVAVEKNNLEYSGVLEQGLEMPVDEDIIQTFRILLDNEGPVMFGSGTKYPIPFNIAKQFSIKNHMAMAIYPKTGKPWQFGIHQCSKSKVWTNEEIRLFHEIGRRISDGLTGLLLFQEISKSEAENRAIVDSVPDLLFRVSKKGTIIDYRKPEKMELYFSSKQFIGKVLDDVLPQHVASKAKIAVKKALEVDDIITFEYDLFINNQKNYFEGRAVRSSQDEVLVVVRDITERKQSEEALRLSEERFSKIFQLSPIAIVIIRNSDNKIVDFNDVFIKETGYTHAEIVNHTTLELNLYVDPKDRDKVLQILDEKGVIENYEFKYRTKSGNIRIGIHSTILINLGGEMHNLSLIQDITERKEHEKELRKLSQAVEQSPASVVITDVNGDIQYVNPKFLKLTGYSKNEVIGQNPRILKSGEMPSEIYSELWKTITSGKEWFGEFYNKKKNGELFWEIASISPISDPNGTITHFLGVKEDITERKLFEKALLESERKYRIVADNTFNWEFWANEFGDYIYCSPSCYRVSGYTAEEYIKDPNLKLNIIHTEYKSEFEKHLQNVMNNEEDVHSQYKIIHKNGSERWIEHICHPVYDEKGNYMGRRGSNQDITEKKETERRILNAIILTEEKERNWFSQDLHDGLGPMLSTVKLYFEWLAETTEASKREGIINTGMENINDAIQAVRDISNKLSPRILNSMGLIPAMKYLIQQLNQTQKINIGLNYDLEKRYNSQIEVTLYRIFSELINNTIKYAKAQSVSIEINHDSTSSRLYAYYKDNGIGFNLNKVFKDNKGMGIQNIIQRIETLNGKIKFDTDEGKPFTVCIELPI